MSNEPSGEYYDYTITMKPERPWLVPWHQSLVYRIMHCLHDGTGKISELFLTFEQALDVIERVYHLTCGLPQIVFLTGWQFEGHEPVGEVAVTDGGITLSVGEHEALMIRAL